MKPSLHRGSALIMILFAVVIVTLLAVTFLTIAKYERASSTLALKKARSEALADVASDIAMLRLKDATEDGLSTGKMWISEPGRIRVYTRSNLATFTDYNLFSALPGPDTSTRDEKNVDLNRPSYNNVFPIAAPAAGNTVANMKVGWIALPANPNNTFSASNPIVGRIAYWVDDESCKIDINTADGSSKQDLYRTLGTGETSKSYGWGTPSEISLQGLQDSTGTQLTQARAAAISAYAWSTGFNSAAEIGRIANLPPNFYDTNRFNLTHYNKMPELTFYGEPRMYLLAPWLVSKKTQTMLTGAYAPQASAFGTTDTTISEPIDFVYPSSRQLPLGLPLGTYLYPTTVTQLANSLPQYFLEISGQKINDPVSTGVTGTAPRSSNFDLLLRITQALNGQDSQGNTIVWPAFGSAGASPATKYGVRQRDSLALQILDMSAITVFGDHKAGFTVPALSTGILGNQTVANSRTELVMGVGRSPKLTEIHATSSYTVGDPLGTHNTVPEVQPNFVMEFYFPKNYLGVPLNDPYTNTAVSQWRFGNNPVLQRVGQLSGVNCLNEIDIGDTPDDQSGNWTTFTPGDPSPLGGYWMNNLLHATGVDLAGNSYRSTGGLDMPDPDQTQAAANHAPYAYNATMAQYQATGDTIGTTGLRFPALAMAAPDAATDTWHPGVYHSVATNTNGRPYPGSIGMSVVYSGGIDVCTHTSVGGPNHNWELAPLDGLRGLGYTNEQPATIKSILQKAVIPISMTASSASTGSFYVRVADPLVNKFPGDWIQITDDSNPSIITPSSSTSPGIYANGGNIDDPAFPSTTGTRTPIDSDGDNPEFKPSGGGDPLSLWLPRQDVRYPKQSRFPSIGALNYVRTGVIPDDLTVDLTVQHGTPWRSINLSADTVSQGTYPDWAMLDLFTVPFIPQPVYYIGGTVTPKRRLTYGGATEGKLNINNPKIPFPFGQTIAGVSQIPPQRTTPLECLFYGIQISTSYSVTGDPVYSTADHVALRKGVQDYLANNNRFLLPGQLSQVPAVDAYTYTGVTEASRSRNDLMRQVLGATTTQGNVFSIWVVAQTIKKNPANGNPAIFEPGDTITGETRRHYLVERHLEYGKDGVPGNAVNPGTDGIVGTDDDPIDANYNPAMTYPLPYRWQIIAVENTQ